MQIIVGYFRVILAEKGTNIKIIRFTAKHRSRIYLKRFTFEDQYTFNSRCFKRISSDLSIILCKSDRSVLNLSELSNLKDDLFSITCSSP